jgi:hypothetical protein
MKSQRAYQFLVVLLLILSKDTFAQQEMPRIGQISPHRFVLVKKKSTLESQSFGSRLFYLNFTLNVLDQPEVFNKLNIQPTLIEIIPPRFLTSHLSFFCNKEFHFEKATSIPLRLRLGSLEYVNKLEGK